MKGQYFAIVRWDHDATKPVDSADALVHQDGGKLLSFWPGRGQWVPSGSADADALAGVGSDVAVKVSDSQAAAILKRLAPTAALLTGAKDAIGFNS